MPEIAKLIDSNLGSLSIQRIDQYQEIRRSGNIIYVLGFVRIHHCQICITEDQIDFS